MRFDFNKKDLCLYLFLFIVCIYLSIETWVLGTYSYLPLQSGDAVQYFIHIFNNKKYGFIPIGFRTFNGNDQSTAAVFT